MPNKNSYLTVTDFFCGAGGSSQGARRLGLEVQLAANHWKLAIETHSANFPDTEHDCVDLREIHPGRYWATNVLLASPECTSHSIAKGRKRRPGQPMLFEEQNIDPEAVRSRATMWTVPDYAEYYDYEVIVVENVIDARKWRPWEGWITAMHNLGYEHEVIYFNSMFSHMRPLKQPKFGDFVPQSRDRMYVVFWKKGNKKPDLEIRPQAWCAKCEKQVEGIQSWKKPQGRNYWHWGRYKVQYVYRCPTCGEEVAPYYYAAMNAIDWTYPITRIGDRKRPLKPRTIERIKKGLEKFANQFLVVNLGHTHAKNNRARPVTEPGFTQTTAQTIGLIAPFVLNTLHGETVRHAGDELPTQTARQSLAMAMPFYLGYANGDGPPHPATDPLLTVHTENGHALIQPMPFVTSVNHSTDRSRPATDVLATQMPHARNSVVIPPFITSVNYFDDRNIPVTDPAGTQTTQTKFGITMPPFMVVLRNNMDAQPLTDPQSTITAAGAHHGLLMPFLMSYYGNTGYQPVDETMATITTVDRMGLVQPDEVPDVEDCYFRMLQPHEIARGMAFDDDYVVYGNKRQQVRQYGNAVTPPVMELLLDRCVESLR